MLIVAGTINVDPAQVEQFSEAAAAMMAATLEEPGCQQYTFSVSVADPGNVQIFEVWDSAADLEAHFEMPHMGTFRETLGQLKVLGRDINRYEVSSSTPM